MVINLKTHVFRRAYSTWVSQVLDLCTLCVSGIVWVSARKVTFDHYINIMCVGLLELLCALYCLNLFFHIFVVFYYQWDNSSAPHKRHQRTLFSSQTQCQRHNHSLPARQTEAWTEELKKTPQRSFQEAHRCTTVDSSTQWHHWKREGRWTDEGGQQDCTDWNMHVITLITNRRKQNFTNSQAGYRPQ